MKKRYVLLLILLAAIGYSYFTFLTPQSIKLGEASFYKNINLELKVVLTHENLPLHYVGNSYSVICQSQNTASFPAQEWDHIEAGWNRVPAAYLGNSLGDEPNVLLESLVTEAEKKYLVTDSATLVVLNDTSVYISFDGCRTFAQWNLKENLPEDLVLQSTPEYETCRMEQEKDVASGLAVYGNCTDLKFAGESSPKFSNVTANNQGSATFLVTSPAFGDKQFLSIETTDFGKTWKNSLNSTKNEPEETEFVSFSKDTSGSWPLQWHITLPYDLTSSETNQFRIVRELAQTNSPIPINEALLEFDEINILVTNKQIQSLPGDPIDIKFSLTEVAHQNSYGPRDYQYLDLSAGFSRPGKLREDGTAINPYGTSFPIFMLGNKIDRLTPHFGSSMTDSKLLLATIETSDDGATYTYDIFLEKFEALATE